MSLIPEPTGDCAPALPLTRGVRIMWAAMATAACAGTVLRWGFSFTAAVLAALALLLVLAAAIDAATFRIPNWLVCAVLCLWAVFAAMAVLSGRQSLPEVLVGSLLGAAAAAGPALVMNAIAAVLGKEGFGGGDIKLLAAAGLFFTWQGNLIALVIACVVGAAIGLVLKVRRGTSKLPFGVGIAAGWIALILL